jgi:hypothetical protein
MSHNITPLQPIPASIRPDGRITKAAASLGIVESNRGEFQDVVVVAVSVEAGCVAWERNGNDS